MKISTQSSLAAVALIARLATPIALHGQTANGQSSSSDLTAAAANGGTVSPVQSPADPMGLPIAGAVMQAGSDAASKNFDQTLLPAAIQFIQQNLPESQDNLGSKAFEIDPSKLTLAITQNVRAYFVYEGAGFVNTLGVNTTGNGVWQGNPTLIFPAVRSSESAFSTAPAGAVTPQDPLLPGDFVNLGVMPAGTQLNFFLIANGANGSTTAWSTAGNNPDGINHVAAFNANIFAVPQLNSPYLFISFEDLWGGGDRDYNDAVFAIDVGQATVNRLIATPEPSLYLSLGAFAGLTVWAKRRSDRHAV